MAEDKLTTTGKNDFEYLKGKWDGKMIQEIAEIHQLHQDIITNSDSIIFRGQGCSEWDLESTLYRRYELILNPNSNKKTEMSINNFLLLSKVHFLEISKKLNRNGGILHLLSEAQHLGTSTPLIDFTSSFENALWFATEKNLVKCSNEHGNRCNPSIWLIKKESDVKTKIEKWESKIIDQDFLKHNKENNFIYKCPITINSKRGISQKSFFILHNASNEEMKTKYNIIQINIDYQEQSKSLETDITKFLIKLGIDHESIYPDLKGVFNSYISNSDHIHFLEGSYLNAKADNTNDKNKKLEFNKKAIEKYKKVIELNPNYISAYYNWGNTLLKIGDIEVKENQHTKKYQEAIEKYEKVIKLNPNYVDAYNNWGSALSKIGNVEIDERIKLQNYQYAIEKYEKVIELNPHYISTYNNWGDALSKIGNVEIDEKIKLQNYQYAIEKFEKAIELNPNYVDAYYNWGNTLLKIGDIEVKENQHTKKYQEAIEKYEKVIKLNPNYISTYNNWGASLTKIGKIQKDKKIAIKLYEQAIEKYEKEIELNPNYITSYNNLISLLIILLKDKFKINKLLLNSLQTTILNTSPTTTEAQKLRAQLLKVIDTILNAKETS